MNQRDGLKVDSFIESNKVLTVNVSCYETNVVTKGQAQSLSTSLTSLLGFAEKMDQPTAWLTGEKNRVKTEVLTKLYPFTNALVCLANSIPDSLMLEKVDISNSALLRYSEIKLNAFAKQITGLSRANLEGLVPYSITEEMIVELEMSLTDFGQLRTEHKLLFEEKKVAAKEFKRIKTEINHFLNKKLDPSIENLRAAHPEFVSKYFTVRQTAKGVHHAYDVLGYITDADSGKPVAYGTVWVEGLEMRTDISQKGTFRFKSLPEGKYRLKIENMDYKTLFVNISRYALEHCKLNIKMESLLVEENQPVV